MTVQADKQTNMENKRSNYSHLPFYINENKPNNKMKVQSIIQHNSATPQIAK